VFLNGIQRADAIFALWTLAVGLGVHALYRLWRR
jgi:hypothetical protein